MQFPTAIGSFTAWAMKASQSLAQARNDPIPDPIDVVVARHSYVQKLVAELRGALRSSMEMRVDLQAVLSRDELCQAYRRRQEHMVAYKKSVEQAMGFLQRTCNNEQDREACWWLKFGMEACPHDLEACPRPACCTARLVYASCIGTSIWET